MEKMRQWTLLAVVGVVAILAGGWFALVSPKRGEAADLRSQAQQRETDNRALKAKIEQLKLQEKDLVKQQAELGRIAQLLPSNPALPSLIRSLTDAADAAGVTLVALEPEEPTLMAVPAAPVTGSTTGTTTRRATAAAAAPTETLAVIPLTVKVSGGFFQMESFLQRVEGLRRAFLVGEFTMEQQKAQGDDVVSKDTLDAEFKARVFMTTAAPAPVAPRPAAADDAAAAVK